MRCTNSCSIANFCQGHPPRAFGGSRVRGDNRGWQARIGMFIVGSEVVPDAEWWAILPPNVSVHAARVNARAPWARWRDDRGGVELEDDLPRGRRQFTPMRLSAVVVGHSSSSLLGGPQWDEAVVETLARELGGEVAVTTNGLDRAAAPRASGVNRPSSRRISAAIRRPKFSRKWTFELV